MSLWQGYMAWKRRKLTKSLFSEPCAHLFTFVWLSDLFNSRITPRAFPWTCKIRLCHALNAWPLNFNRNPTQAEGWTINDIDCDTFSDWFFHCLILWLYFLYLHKYESFAITDGLSGHAQVFRLHLLYFCISQLHNYWLATRVAFLDQPGAIKCPVRGQRGPEAMARAKTADRLQPLLPLYLVVAPGRMLMVTNFSRSFFSTSKNSHQYCPGILS